MAVTCANGHRIALGNKFCGQCGAPITGVVAGGRGARRSFLVFGGSVLTVFGAIGLIAALSAPPGSRTSVGAGVVAVVIVFLIPGVSLVLWGIRTPPPKKALERRRQREVEEWG